MDGRGAVPQDRQDSGARSGTAGSRGNGIVDWAVLFATLSSVAIGAQLVIVIIALTDEEFRASVLFLRWLGIAAVILGVIGLAAAPPHSRVRALCAVDTVLGVLGLVGMLVVLYLAIRNSTWGPVFPTGPTG
jgi:hypothetical protein